MFFCCSLHFCFSSVLSLSVFLSLYTYTHRPLSLSLYIYIYVYIFRLLIYIYIYLFIRVYIRNRNGTVIGIATRLGTGQMGVRIPAWARYFSLLQIIQTASRAYPAFYSMCANQTLFKPG